MPELVKAKGRFRKKKKKKIFFFFGDDGCIMPKNVPRTNDDSRQLLLAIKCFVNAGNTNYDLPC